MSHRELQTQLDKWGPKVHGFLMRNMLVLAGLPFVLTLACSSKVEGPSIEPVQVNGQTGSVGYSCADSECQTKADLWLASVDPSNVAPMKFVGSSCDVPGDPTDCFDATNTYCRCVQESGQDYEVKMRKGAPNACAWRGLGPFCLLGNSEVLPCDPTQANACDSTCADLEQRYAEDESRVSGAKVRFARCATRENWLSGNTGGGPCVIIARIDDWCYATDSSGFFNETPQDCSLSDQQIAFPAPSGDPPTAGGGSAGGASYGSSRVCAGSLGGTSYDTNGFASTSLGGTSNGSIGSGGTAGTSR